MRIERLVTMANDIGNFFKADPDKAEAARNVASHVRRFWDPRMRREIIEHYREGGHGLEDVARNAIALLADAGDDQGQRAEGKGQREGTKG